ncbi:hypothetical protein CsSME_00044389 [Camellia sinensis var. sinensis]
MPRKLMRILKKLREEDPAYYQLCHLVRHSEQPREELLTRAILNPVKNYLQRVAMRSPLAT